MFLHSPDSIPTSCSRALFNYYGYTLVLDHRTKELQLENAETMRRKPAMSSIAGAFLLVLCLCASIPVQGQFKQCTGTQLGPIPELHGFSSSDRLELYKQMYTNCTFVEYNLEIVGLDASADLSFLADIEQVEGYILIAGNQFSSISLPKLILVYGENLYFGRVLRVTDNPLLQEIRLPELSELAVGSALFINCSKLCYVRYSIQWAALQPQGTAKNNFSGAALQASCPALCSSGFCWGSSTSQKLPFTYVGSQNCSGCDPGATHCVAFSTQCCDEVCAVGCQAGFAHNRCFACKATASDGTQLASSGTTTFGTTCESIRNCPMKESAFHRCVSSCPEPLLRNPFSGVFVCDRSCGFQEFDFAQRTCVTPSTTKMYCQFRDELSPLLHAGNIGQLRGCQVLWGSLLINEISFTGYSGNGISISPISLANLTLLSSLQEIQGFLAVVGVSQNLSSLSFLSNLRSVFGVFDTYRNVYSVFIARNTGLKSLDLTNMQSIQYGNVAVLNNSDLCTNADWSSLTRRPSQQVAAYNASGNKDWTSCVTAGLGCDAQCNSTLGCWGTGPRSCLACANRVYKDECLATCNFNSSSGQCVACDPSCAQDRCSGPTGANCTQGCVGLQQAGACVANCSGAYYAAPSNSVCQPCSPLCTMGAAGVSRTQFCSGPASYVNNNEHNSTLRSGCHFCSQVQQDLSGFVKCVTPVQVCPAGFFKEALSLNDQGGQPLLFDACKQCNQECSACTAAFTNTMTCTCKNLRENNQCVSRCSNGYANGTVCTTACDPQCSGVGRCTGPSNRQCSTCNRLFTMRANVKECVATCPADLPVYEIDNLQCIATCPANHYIQQPMNVCRECNTQCVGGCEDGSQASCVSCANFFNNVTGECVSSCPPSTAPDNTTAGGNMTCYFVPTVIVPRPTQQESSSGVTIGAAAGGVVGGLILIAVIIALIYWRRNEKKRKLAHQTVMYQPDVEEIPELPVEYREVPMSSLKIGGTLGSGSFGTVHKAVWQPEGRNHKFQIGLKVLEGSHLLEPQNLELTKEYVQVLSSLDHSCIVRVLCVTLDDSKVGIGYQFMPYGSLLLFMHQRRRYITSKALLTYCSQVCNGMVYLKKQGIIHRNLRAANILVHRPDQVQIVDPMLAELTQSSGTLLPVEWQAPECLLQGDYSFNSDVWSFGVTLWEILTLGAVPYADRQEQDMIALLNSGDRLTQPNTCTIDIYKLMLQSWIGEANGRPKMQELYESLQPMVEDSERYIILRPGQLNDIAHPQARRHQKCSGKQLSVGTTLSTVSGFTYEEELANYDAYEDIDNMFVDADGLYSSVAIQDTSNTHLSPSDVYDNRPMSPASSTDALLKVPEGYADIDENIRVPGDIALVDRYSTTAAAGAAAATVAATAPPFCPEGYADIDENLKIGPPGTSSGQPACPEGYADIDENIRIAPPAASSGQLENSTTFTNPAYMALPDVPPQAQATVSSRTDGGATVVPRAAQAPKDMGYENIPTIGHQAASSSAEPINDDWENPTYGSAKAKPDAGSVPDDDWQNPAYGSAKAKPDDDDWQNPAYGSAKAN